MADKLISIHEVCELTTYGPKKVREMVAAEEMPAPVIGGPGKRWLWRLRTIEAWLERDCRPLRQPRKVVIR